MVVVGHLPGDTSSPVSGRLAPWSLQKLVFYFRNATRHALVPPPFMLLAEKPMAPSINLCRKEVLLETCSEPNCGISASGQMTCVHTGISSKSSTWVPESNEKTNKPKKRALQHLSEVNGFSARSNSRGRSECMSALQ